MSMSGYVALCYHYIRPPKAQDPFPRLLGTRRGEFHRHLALLQERYEVLSPAEAWRVSYDAGFSLRDGRVGLLLTFDDGLADHYRAACDLAERGIRALFFIPTCVLEDRLPANPTIIHYGIAAYGIEGFLQHARAALEEQGLPVDAYSARFQRGVDDPWVTIDAIKTLFTYRLPRRDARAMLLNIYRRSLLAEDPEALATMHLTPAQVREMLLMGHGIGTHSHSHVSIGATAIDESEFLTEVVAPKERLEQTFQISVNALSYPFGDPRDCLQWEELLRRTRAYDLAFTVQEAMNTKRTSPLELGRYQTRGADTAEAVDAALRRMMRRGHGTAS